MFTQVWAYRRYCHSFSMTMKFRVRVVSSSIVALKKFEGKNLKEKKPRIFKKMLFREKDS